MDVGKESSGKRTTAGVFQPDAAQEPGGSGQGSSDKGTTPMWTELFEVKNRYIAELWKELFDAEGLANRVVIAGDPAQAGDMTPRKIYVPDSKTHVASEILRKI